MFDVIGKNIREARQARGWSQRFVAEQINISHQSLSRLENGYPVSSHLLKKVAGFLQISLNELYKEEATTIKRTVAIPDNVMAKLILNSQPIVESIYQESVFRYKHQLKQDGILLQKDIENLIAQYFSNKTSYSMSDLIYVGMLANQKTLEYAMAI